MNLRPSKRPRWSVEPLVTAFCLFTGQALAQTSAADSGAVAPLDDATETAASARDAFKRGTELARAAEWTDALAAFERSGELRSHAVTTYNIAFCERALGRYTRARKLFAKALLDNRARGGIELPDNLATAADDYLADLDRKLARLTITLWPPDAAVAIDDAPLELVASQGGRPLLIAGTRATGAPEAVGASSFELLLNPGAHKMVVFRAGYQSGTIERTVAPGDRGELELRATLPASARPETREQGSVSGRLPIYAAFGVGGAGVAVGVVAGIIAIGKARQLDQLCPGGRCEAGTPHSTLQTAHTAADVATIGFVVGAAGAATGFGLWWLLRPTSKPESQQSQLGVEVGVGSLLVTKRF